MEPSLLGRGAGDDSLERAPRFKVDLDQPAIDRWKEIVEKYHSKILHAQQCIHNDILSHVGQWQGAAIEKVAQMSLGTTARFRSLSYKEELQALSSLTGLSLGTVIFLQFAYEATAYCTSIIVPRSGDQVPLHARTMDWEMDYLRPLTIEVEFWRGGSLLFVATTWAGYVGILTAVKPQRFSLSINFRCCNTGNIFTNIMSAIKGGWPVAVLIRSVFEAAQTFTDAVEMLKSERLVAPTYISVAGSKPGEGILLTRDRTVSEREWRLDTDGPIVQTNIDFWDTNPAENICESLERRALAHKIIRESKVATNGMNLDQLWLLMRTEPIRNPVTIYTSLMCAADGLMESWTELKPTGDPSKFTIF